MADTITNALRAMFPDTVIRPIDWTAPREGEWATPCMCGHHDHGYSGHCEHMCCTEGDDCDCGGFEPQPGMRLPPRAGREPPWLK